MVNSTMENMDSKESNLQQGYSISKHSDFMLNKQEQSESNGLNETGCQKIKRMVRQAFQASDKYSTASRRLFKSKVALEQEKELHEMASTIDQYLVHPFSILRLVWEIIMIMCILLYLCLTPLRVVYHGTKNTESTRTWVVMCYILQAMLWFDIIINFRSGYLEDYTRKVIMQSKVVVIHYLKTSFPVDFISSVPTFIELTLQNSGIDWVTDSAEEYNHKAGKIYLICGMVHVFSLFNFSRLFRYLKRIQILFHLPGRVWRILNLILVVTVASHWNSCFQFAIASWEVFPTTSWIVKKGLLTKGIPEIYAHSIFKTFSHMLSIGYGYFAPQSTLETLATIVSMLIGAIFYAMFVADLNHMVMQSDTAGNKYDEKIEEVKQFMTYHRLPKQFRQKVIQYYDTKYNQQYFDPHTMLQKINPKIKAQIMYLICKQLVVKSSLFEDASKDLIMDLCSYLHYEIFMPEDIIVTAGHKSKHMYFIEHGLVQVSKGDDTVVMSMGDGTHFGEMSLIYDETSEVTVTASETTHTYYLTKEDFEQLMLMHSGARDHILDIVTERCEATRVQTEIIQNKLKVAVSHVALDTDSVTSLRDHKSHQKSRFEVLHIN